MFTVMFFGIIAKTIGDLRWALFAQKGKEGQQIPTPRTLVSHTSRSFYMFLVWKLKRLPLAYPHLRPTHVQLESVEGHLKLVFCQMAPTPKAFLHLRKSDCKTGCTKQICDCMKCILVCTNRCGCEEMCEI